MAGCQNVVQTIFRVGHKEVRPLLSFLFNFLTHSILSRFER